MVPMKVSPIEARLIALLDKGYKPVDIQTKMEIHRSVYHQILGRLVSLNILTKIKLGQYKLNEPYEVIFDLKELIRSRSEGIVVNLPVHPVFNVTVTREMKLKIAHYYEHNIEISRYALCKQLGLPKYLLNMTVMEMGLEQSPRNEEEFEEAYGMVESGC